MLHSVALDAAGFVAVLWVTAGSLALQAFGGGALAAHCVVQSHRHTPSFAEVMVCVMRVNLCTAVLDNKLEAEKALRSSGLDWTIVR
jgi:uncharacterized protein YbjT (DUF2867 family)